MTTGEAIKNELKAAITLEFLYKKTSSNEKISYTLVSLINHDGDSLDCRNYASSNTVYWTLVPPSWGFYLAEHILLYL